MVVNSIKDTIAAIATPLGTGGVGIVRMSGDKAIEIVSSIFSSSLNEKVLPEFKENRIYHGWVVAKNLSIKSSSFCHSEFISESQNLAILKQVQHDVDNFVPVDEVVVLIFKAPKSYTGEDVVEIQCHGGLNIVKNILKLCFESGARLAEKGEFTKRAFLNGKMDLSEAEAVLDLIQSKTDQFSTLSFYNLSGKLSSYINNLRKDLLDLVSQITAAIDFPEEVDDLEYDYLENKIKSKILDIDHILVTSDGSNLMRHGLKIAIVGKPNVGKSSLFNALLNIERSIVTSIPGTTRDIIQESINIAGIPVVLIDTAGIRELETNEGSDYIEFIGINITRSYIKDADLILLLQDLTEEINTEIICHELLDKPVITIGTKLDLIGENKNNTGLISVSSKTGEGMELIKKAIENFIFSKNLPVNSEFTTNLRQQECLLEAKNSLLQALDSTKNKEVQDFIAIDLKSSLLALGEITGEVVSDEIINNIFSNFCIGK